MRHESDLLGTMALPDATPYGVRTARIVKHLSVSDRRLGDYPGLVRAMLAVKRATARANAKAGVLETRTLAAIEDAINRVSEADADWSELWPVDALHGGGSIGFNVNVNDVLARLAGLDGKRDINASQSTADVCATAFRLAVTDASGPVLEAAALLSVSLSKQAERCHSVTTLARTCLQDAMPVTLSALFEGYAALVERRTDKLRRAMSHLSAINLGGTVIGSGDGSTPAYRDVVVAELSSVVGRPLQRRESLYDAAQNSDDLVDVVDAAVSLSDALLKLARDLRLLASGPDGGFGEIELPAIIEGSSFFAGKINPVVPETVMQAVFQVQGLAHAAKLAASHRELYLNVFEGQTALNAIDIFGILGKAIVTLTNDAVNGLAPRPSRCAQLVETHLARQSEGKIP